MKLGPTPQNSWEVSQGRVSLVRPALPARPVEIAASPQDLVIDLSRTGIVVIDMQNDFCASDGWFAAKGLDIEPGRRIIPALERLVGALRQSGGAVFWLNWGNRPDLANLPPSVLHAGNPTGTGIGYGDMLPGGGGPVLQRGSKGAAIVDGLEVAAGDVLVHKTRLSGFIDNDFDSILKNRAITTLLFAGINTDRCVLATLIHASFLGYDCILVEDVCATSSPDYCTEATVFLVKQLYGFTTRSSSVIDGLRAAEATSRG